MKNIHSAENRADDTASAILESLPDAVYLIDPKGVILNTNTLFASQFGLQPQECIGANVYDLIKNVLQLPELAAYHSEKSEEILRTGKRVVFADERDVRKVTMSPVLSKGGEITRLLITIQNIAEQKRIHKELQKERTLKTALVDSIPCSAVILDADLHIISSNQYARDMLFGKNEHGQPQVDPAKFFCPEDMVLLREKFNNTLTSGIEDCTETRVQLHGSHQYSWMMTQTRRIVIEGKPCVVSIGIDISERKHKETELIYSKERLNFALEAAHAGVWEWNLETDILIWSKEVWSLHGLELSNEKPTFQIWVSTIYPDDREMTRLTLSEAIRNNSDLNYEYRVCYPDGSVHWLMSRGKLLHNEEETSKNYIGTVIDITERKKIELELSESKLRYNYAMEASHTGIWEWDVKTDTLNWSEQVWGLYGLQVNSVPLNNQLCVDTIHPDDREMASWIIRDAVSKGIAASLEYRTCHPDGSVHWLTSRGMPLRDAEGKVTRYIGAIIDITKRKQIETELIDNKERLIFALEATSAGVWEWDVTEDRVIWTDNIWKLYDLEKNSLPHTHRLCESNIHPEDRDLMFEKVMESANKEVEIHIEYRVCHKDGSIHWLRCQGQPKYDSDGRLKCYIGTVTDITTRRELLNDLTDSKTRLAMALNAARAGVWEWQLKTGENIWSDETWLLYGLEKNGRRATFDLWRSTIHPDDRQKTVEAISTAADNETDLNIEYRILYADGSVHWLMSRGKPFYDKTGKADRYIGTSIDITERKEIEEEYRMSRERLDFVLENSHVGVWDLNLQNGSTLRTLEHAHIFGYETMPPDWTLEKFYDHVIPEDRVKVKELLSNIIEKQETYSYEFRIRAANGELRWIWAAGAFKRGMQGESNHIVGVVRDITLHKKADQEVITSRAILHAALESMNDSVFISDVEGKFIEFNSAFARFHRFKDKQDCLKSLNVHLSILDVFMTNGEPAPFEQWPVPRALRGDDISGVEYTLHRKDSGETWVGSYNFSPIRNHEGKIIGAVVTARDITEQKRIQTAIIENERKFRTIFDYSPFAISIGNLLDGTLIDVNKSWERIFGYTKEEVVGRSIKDLGLYLQNEDYESNLAAINEHGKIVNKPMQFRNKSGKKVQTIMSGEQITVGDIICILMLSMDITVQKLQQVSIERLEQTVAVRTKQLKDEVKRLNSFLHMISHEYRTPLAIIRGNLDLIELKNKNRSCENPLEMQKIRRAIDRLVEVMEESMHESRFLESRTVVPLKVVELVSVIASQVESFLALWPDRFIQYSSHLEACDILGDPSQLKLAIFNLIDNARKYSPPGSTIELECCKEGDEAVIRIRNQGIPITKGDAESVFEKYQRGHNSMNTSGAGIGLWMVKNIIERHNGKVRLEGFASGVEATIHLPLVHTAG